MSLTIRYSDRIDSLAADLKANLLQDRSDPFAFRQVVVPNGNLAKWLQMRVFADEPSLCAGIDFPFMDHFLLRLLVEALPEEERARRPGQPPSATGAIASVLLSDPSPALAPLRRYVDPGAKGRSCRAATEQAARKLWQLGAKLAELFKEYELRRPGLIAGWLGKDPLPEGKDAAPVEQAEAALYRAVHGPDGILAQSAPSLRGLFGKAAGTPPPGPGKTFYLFGHSSLSPLHAEILHWLAQTHEVVFYHLTVCVEYWGDIEAPWERIRRADPSLFVPEDSEGDDLGIENELLDGWGRAGRSTMKLMIDKEEASTADCPVELDALGDAPEPAASDSVLSIAQASVRHRTSDLPRRKQDASVQVVACQSIRREVEMVYNAILGAVLDPAEAGATGKRPWAPCDFSDIAVLVPDMAAYRPMIEAVFDARGQIPYGLIDATASQTSRFLQGTLDLLRLAGNGLDRTTLFPVLENPCVQRALRYDPDQLASWRRRVDEIGAFRSFDDADGRSRGLAKATNFTWDRALSRLRLAAVAAPGSGDGTPALCGDGSSDDLRLSEIVERLYRRLAPLKDKELPFAPPAEDGEAPHGWIDELVSLLDAFLAADPDDSLETGVRRDLLASVRSLSVVSGRHPLPSLVQFIEQTVGATPCRRGGYLTSGVTIAALQPMRPVPFRQIFVLGLGEAFPGMVSDSSLDLRGLAARLGDARMPDINRYLFLETFMATRDRLVLSYLSKDIKKDADLFPSPVVRDLRDFLEKYVLEKDGDGKKTPFREIALPLLESDPRCTGAVEWDDKDPAAGIVPTYHAKARIAERVRGGWEEPSAALSLSDGIREAGREDGAPGLSLGTLARFMDRPLRTILNKRFGVAVEGYQDATIEDHEPLALAEGTPTWDLEGALFDKWLETTPELDEDGMEAVCRRALQELQDKGRLPEGVLGTYETGRVLARWKERGWLLRLFRSSGLHEAGLGAMRPFHAACAVDVTIDGKPRKALLTGSFKRYFPQRPGEPAVDTMAVFRKYDWKDGQPPPAAGFEPFLVWLAARAAGDGAPALEIKFLQADGDKASAARWEASPEEARQALTILTQDWFDYVSSADESGRFADFKYKDLQALCRYSVDSPPSIEKGTDWQSVCEGLADAKGDYRSKSVFNNDLVIQGIADELARPPLSGEEIQDICGKRYALFFRCGADKAGPGQDNRKGGE